VSALASSPAAAAYDKAAAASPAASVAEAPGAGFFAAAPASPGGGPPQLLMEKGKLGTGEAAGDNVYNVLKANAAAGKDFSVLVALVDKAGLAGALADPNTPITLFAPTDEAFKKFAANAGKSVGDLQNDKPAVIKALLLQHVATESKKLTDLAPGEAIGTKGTSDVRVDSTNPTKIAVIGGPGGDSTAETGVSTANGKGHIIAINKVLLPPQSTFENTGV
jgi:uncharacterized surface protein with fasciclin (FAS1) repeats